MANFSASMSGGMWRVVFVERRGYRLHVDRTGPWLPSKTQARQWADWFKSQGYHVALQDQAGGMERLCAGLPG